MTSVVMVSIGLDGSARLFCGRATDTRMRDGSEGQPYIIEVVIAGNVEVFFALMDLLYSRCGYFGQVDVGVAVTGIRGAASMKRNQNCQHPSASSPVAHLVEFPAMGVVRVPRQ